MQRVIGSLLLVLVLSSFVAASSIAVGFTIKDSQEIDLDQYDYSVPISSRYGLFLVGGFLILVGFFFIFKYKNNIKIISSKKKVQTKKKLTAKKPKAKKRSPSKKK